MATRAAIYLRSSKDRSDVSIHAQRRALQAMATERGQIIVREYADTVESAKDERRPAFQQLLRDMRDPDRGWSVLLMVDPSRLSRRQYMAQVFGHEAQRAGIAVLYQQAPPSDPIADLVVVSVLQLVAELHSHMSREKGLAGMAENVRRGWRAGGRAPRGYRLKAIETGAVREGAAVTKTVLEPDADAPRLAAYLAGRADGRARRPLAEELGIDWPDTTLIGIERNALTYAGCTVWNRSNAKLPEGGYKGGTRDRPREEWTVQEATHEALISMAQAEAILAARRRQSPTRRRGSAYLLSGIMRTPAGEPWHGDGTRYRVATAQGKRSVQAEAVEGLVVGAVLRDMRSEAFVRALANAARKEYRATEHDPAATIRKDMVEIDRQIERTLVLAADLGDPAPALRRIDGLEQRRKGMAEQLAAAEESAKVRSILAGVTEESVRRLLDSLAEQVDEGDRGRLKDMMRAIIDRVELDPATLGVRLCYAVAVGGIELASPGEREANTTLRVVTSAVFSRRRMK